MTAGLVAQAPTLALVDWENDAQATQAAVLALSEVVAPALITQNATLLLAEYNANHMITQVALLCLAPVVSCTTRDAQCWRIEREDGTTLGFTTHDRPLTFDGLTYEPCASLRASAISSSVFGGASTGDVQANGIIDDDAISAEDLYVGRYDNANVLVYLVDWETLDRRLLTRGIVSKTEQGLTQYRMTAMTGGARLQQQPLLRVYSPLCSAEFGDTACGYDVESLRLNSSVTGKSALNVVTQAPRRVFQDTAMAGSGVADYNNGRLTWTSGANNGLTVEVKSVDDGVVTLWKPMPADIEAGDTYSIVPGCDKTQATCTAYANFANFRGFPDVPGNDALNQTPNQ